MNGYRDASKSLRGFLIRGKHPEIDWLVIAQKKNNIVESGSRENEPYEQYLAENIEFRSSLIPDKKSSKSQRFNKLIPF